MPAGSCIKHGPFLSDVDPEILHAESAISCMSDAMAAFAEAEYWFDRYNESANLLDQMEYQMPHILGEYDAVGCRGISSVNARTLPIFFALGAVPRGGSARRHSTRSELEAPDASR